MHTFGVIRSLFFSNAVLRVFALQVVFSAAQLSWLTAEQAWAVTEEQWAELDPDQRQAVALARYDEDVLQELRGVIVIKAHFNKLFL